MLRFSSSYTGRNEFIRRYTSLTLCFIGIAKHLLEIHEKWFEGSPSFLNDGTEYVPELDHEESQYTGEPSKEIDRNWELLHWGESFHGLQLLSLFGH